MKNPMENETKPAQPVIGEYQEKPIIHIPVEKPDTTWHWLSLRKNKVKTIKKSVLAQFVIPAKTGRRLDSSRIQIFLFCSTMDAHWSLSRA
jgi:hypothetical protein